MSLKGTSVELAGTGKTVTVDDQIGEGAEGEIYGIKGDDSAVLKIFDEGERKKKAPKVQAMLKDSNRPDDPATDFHSIVWPQSEVRRSGTFLGYKMPYLDQGEWSKALAYQMMELADSDLKERLRPAYNLSYMIHEIHEQGHALGDFNHENIFVKNGYIALIDCDGFHINASNTVYEGETFKPRYSPPEKRPSKLDEVKEADRFCLGVHIFQFLMEGWHPYQAKGPKAVGGNFNDKIDKEGNKFPYVSSSPGYDPPEDGLQQKYDDLPQDIRELFKKCFSTGSTAMGWGRPSATKWARTLGLTDALDLPENELPKKGDGGGGTSDTGPENGHQTPDDDLKEKAKGIFGNQSEEESGTGNTKTQSNGDDDSQGDGDETDLTEKAKEIFGNQSEEESGTGNTKTQSNGDDDSQGDGDETDLTEKAKEIFNDDT